MARLSSFLMMLCLMATLMFAAKAATTHDPAPGTCAYIVKNKFGVTNSQANAVCLCLGPQNNGTVSPSKQNQARGGR